MLYALSTTMTKDAAPHKAFMVGKIMKGELKSEAQLSAAMKYFAKVRELVESDFNRECGVGIDVSADEIKNAVADVIGSKKEALLEERYHFNMGSLMKEIRDKPNMRWADGKLLKDSFDEAILNILGPKVESDLVKKKKEKPKEERIESKGKETGRKFEGEVLRFHKPGENKQLNDEIMKKHLEATGGKVVTRFPPEPNGFLHIGHAKAINFNFSYAQVHNGITYLRYDDTNPEAEEEMYFNSILDTVQWLGFTPYKVTYASDNFDKLYELAEKMILKGKAYVCHMTAEEIHASRGGEEKGARYDSPWRNRPIEESLKLFRDMRDGKFKEGEATLRMKMDMQNPNPYMWDPVAYRVLDTPHVRTGDKWKIYPSYDFTHCLCDSIENITHSLCTTEFVLARESYYWVCDTLEVYKAVQWEYGRLGITNTVLSKRRLIKLVKEGYVRSWDDPRLYTLVALRRRGFTPAAINNFVEQLGITTADTTVDVRLLESCVRDDLNRIALRRMAVLDPVPVNITNLPNDHLEMISICDYPNEPHKGPSREVPFTNRVYIDRSDFRVENADDPNYFRLAPGKSVGLYKAYVITCTGYKVDDAGKVISVDAVYHKEEEQLKPKTYIQWIADCPKLNSPMKAEVRIYKNLFLSKNPMDHPDGWLADINPNSLEIVPDALVDIRMKDAKPEDKFQFQRVGFFCCDPDSTADKLVFNLTVSIKEDAKKD